MADNRVKYKLTTYKHFVSLTACLQKPNAKSCILRRGIAVGPCIWANQQNQQRMQINKIPFFGRGKAKIRTVQIYKPYSEEKLFLYVM